MIDRVLELCISIRKELPELPAMGQETAEDEIIEPPLIYTADSKGPLVC